MIDIKEYFGNIGLKYKTDALLKDYTTFKIGGKCPLMVFPDTVDKLSEVIKYLNENNIKYYPVGKGSNLLVSDEGYDGIIVNMTELEEIRFENNDTLICLAGTSLMRVCRFALENELTGLEFAYGIPGSVGGSAYMNAGAYGGEMKDVIVSCTHILPDGSVGSYSADKLGLSYRHSVYTDNGYIVASVTLKLKKGNKADIKAKMDELLGKRKAKQPLEYPSAGSTFKRPEGYFAGALIEECNLKGYSVGGAQVSEKHAGFVINKADATCKDVCDLVNFIQLTVKNQTGVILEPEIKIIK